MKRVQLAIGGDAWPAGREGNAKAQKLFLQAVRELVPECLRDLARIARSLPDWSSPRVYQEASVTAWAKRYGFSTRWMMRCARQTAEQMGQTARWSDWVFTASAWIPAVPSFPDPTWDPTLEREGDFLARVDQYRADVKRTPGLSWVKRQPEIFEWLALHNVAGWNETRIGAKYRKDFSTVSRGLKEAALLVGVPLRRARGRTLQNK